MWIVFAVASAVFAGVTSIFAKIGIKNNSEVVTAIRTVVVLAFSWLMVLVDGTYTELSKIDGKSFLFLGLSGLATGASWLCYYKALTTGEVSKVAPIDKSSTVLTILLSFIILREGVTIFKGIGIVLIAAGTFLMVFSGGKVSAKVGGGAVNASLPQSESESGLNPPKKSKSWVLFAVLSAVFASLAAILAKIGIKSVGSNLATALRTCVVLVMAWAMVFITGNAKKVKTVTKKELLFIVLSGLATGASWLCYYKALKDGVTSAVVAIDKLSILVTIGFSCLVLKEKLSLKSILGLVLLVGGTFCMLF